MTFLAALATVAAVAAFAAVLPGRRGDDYPNRPITLVVPLPPGGTNDIMARAVADKMSAALGQQIVVENRDAGGSGTVGTREVAHAAARRLYDPARLYLDARDRPEPVRNVGYDPRKDFAPIGLIASAPALLLVHKDLAAHNVGELIALMKSSKEPYQVGTPGIGTVNYLACVLFRPTGGRQGRADSLQGLEPADHRYDRRPRQGRIHSDPGVARRARRRLHPRAGRDLPEAFDADAESCRRWRNRAFRASTPR